MISGGVTLIVWGAIFLTASIVVLVFAVKFLMAAKRSKLEAEKIVQMTEVRLHKEYNKIATLPVKEFHEFLITSFAKSLELASYQWVSKHDPDRNVVLYAMALKILLEYLGESNIVAIEYYYGHEYISRWCKMSYELLEKRGVTAGVIDNKAMQSSTISRSLGLGVKGEG